MATEEEIFKYIAKVEGEDKVKDLAAKAALAEQKFKALYETLGASDAATRAAASALVDVNKQLKEVEKVAGKGGNGAANALTQLGYAADDAQYGMKGLANNIQPILSSIPQLAGLAPVISIAAIAAYQLYEHWDSINALFGQGKVKTQAEEMEELRKKTEKTADETARLLKYEEMRQHVAAQHGRTDPQTEAGKEIDQAIRNAPSATIEDAVRVLYDKELRRSVDPEARKQRDETQNTLRSAEKMRADGNMNKGQYEAFQQAAKDAQANYDKLYQEQVEKKMASLGVTDRKGNPKNFNDFMARLEKRPDLQPDAEAMDRLRHSQISPKEKAELDKARKQQLADKAAEDEQLTELDNAAKRDFAEKKRKADKQREVDEAVQGVQDDGAVQDKKDREEEAKARQQKAKDDLAKAKEIPGMEQVVRGMLKQMLGSGMSEADAQAALINKLDDRLGTETAGNLVRGETAGVENELMMDYLNGPQRSHRNSQVIGGAELANSIQSAVGGDDTAKKQLAEQERMRIALETIVRQPRGSGPMSGIVVMNGPGGAAMVGG